MIEPSQSTCASSVVLVLKSDGSWSFYVSYRRLTVLKTEDESSIPPINACLDSLGDAPVFTALDVNFGYWHVLVRAQDRDKTAFTCESGSYSFTRRYFGLITAPAIFQRAIHILKNHLKWRKCIVYLRDITIFSNNLDGNLRHVRDVVAILRDAGITLKMISAYPSQIMLSILATLSVLDG